ncbi:hypothetical protein GCM10027290_08860 [Micromonospora sonneratiae]|uniref:Uncharacterized protein n=1 Tax=Micromonospora sonneratiae TaxID=1184706 RepID=A0ABW3YGX2_9ACTN
MTNPMTGRVRATTAAIRRVSRVSLLVRSGAALTALVAFVVAYPTQLLTSRLLPVLLIVALLPALTPRRAGATLALLTAVAGWVVSTSWYDEPIVLWRLLALATLLYLTHSLSALAALLPFDAVVSSEVVVRWVLRALGVTLASAVLGVLLIALAERGSGDRTFLAVALAGLAVAVATSALLAWLVRRR